MKKTKLYSLLSVTIILGITVGSNQAFAWENQQPDPNTVQQEIKKTGSATVPAQGIFKEFDPTDPTDPTDPNPDPGDDAWVDVKIPTKVLFGQTDVSKNIISPSYEVENLSSKGVKVSVSDFQSGKDADKLPELNLNIKNLTNQTSLTVVDADPSNISRFPAELGSITNQGEKFNFTMTGNVGKTFDFSQTINPQYTLVLEFEVL